MQQPENFTETNNLDRVALGHLIRHNFSQEDLKRVCEMHESEFGERYGMTKVMIPERTNKKPSAWSRSDEKNDYYYFKDNGSDILSVAHLDTVIDHSRRTCSFVETESGLVVFSGALDDRLGAYIILELLPALGINHDILLTIGEECGESTAAFFEPPKGKEYNWMIEFDRGDTDVVMYQYDDYETRELVRQCGARPGLGSYSDIAFLDQLEVKGFNWGVAYQDYHGPRGHAWLEDTFTMLGHYVQFWVNNRETYLPHEEQSAFKRGGRGSGGSYGGSYSGWGNGGWGDDDDLYPDVCLECGDNIRESALTPGLWRDTREHSICPNSDDGYHHPDDGSNDDSDRDGWGDDEDPSDEGIDVEVEDDEIPALMPKGA